MTNPRSVVVVGGGPAGVSVCRELRAGGYAGRLTLVDAGALLHDRPPLSKDYLRGTATEADLALLPDGWAGEHDVTIRSGCRATRLRAAEGALELDGGELLTADAVVLATGGLARPLPAPVGTREGVLGLRTVDDARALRRLLLPGARVTVVGGGLIGAEVAATATGLGCTVTLVEPLDPPIARLVGEPVARWLHDEHAAAGVRVLTGQVAEVTATRAVRVAGPTGEQEIPSDVVVVGVGSLPEVGLAGPLEQDAGIVVDERWRTSVPAVLAVGDVARVRGVDGVLQPRIEHWDGAVRSGAAAAATLLDRPVPAVEAPWFWSDRYGHHVEAAGRIADAERFVARGAIGDDRFAVFGLAGERCVAAVTVDDGRLGRAARRLVTSGAPVDESVLADPSGDPRRLVRR